MDVHVRVKKPDETAGKNVRQCCNAELDTKLKAALALKRTVAQMLGDEAVRQAEQVLDGTRGTREAEPTPAVPTGPNAAELQWLAEWIDSMPCPDKVTAADAEAALQRHRGESTLARIAAVQLLVKPK